MNTSENPRDFEHEPTAVVDAFAAECLPLGLCVGSKSGYRRAHRRHFFVPNANVACRTLGKVWWGDLDLWRHDRQLERVARRLRTRLYVLREMDARFEKADVPFAELRRHALWHTGGRVSPNQRLIARAGLSLKNLALLVGVSPRRLVTRQLPFVSQQINRRLSDWDESVGALARELGFRKWGAWMSAPHAKLSGRTPYEVLRAGGTILFADVFEEVFSDEIRFAKMHDAVLRGFALQYGTSVTVEWPLRSHQK
jgi:hypothetical protein